MSDTITNANLWLGIIYVATAVDGTATASAGAAAACTPGITTVAHDSAFCVQYLEMHTQRTLHAKCLRAEVTLVWLLLLSRLQLGRTIGILVHQPKVYVAQLLIAETKLTDVTSSWWCGGYRCRYR